MGSNDQGTRTLRSARKQSYGIPEFADLSHEFVLSTLEVILDRCFLAPASAREVEAL